MPFVVSTLANSQNYTAWEIPPAASNGMSRPAVAKKKVFVNGGAGVQGVLRTPDGVLTKITEEDADFLETVELFQVHKKGGHVKIIQRESDPDKVAKDLKKDIGDVERGERVSGGSAQLSVAAGDFEQGGRAAGVAPALQKTVI